jgi:hypothetical protein
MDRHDHGGRTPHSFRKGRSVVGLTVVMTLAVVAYIGLRVALPELPPYVLHALTALPS